MLHVNFLAEVPGIQIASLWAYHHFNDKRLWKTKHPRKRFQNFGQSGVLLTDRIEIHQLQPLGVTF